MNAFCRMLSRVLKLFPRSTLQAVVQGMAGEAARLNEAAGATSGFPYARVDAPPRIA